MRMELEYFDDNGNRDVNGLNFRGVDAVELGGASVVIDRAFLRVVVARGSATYTAYFGVMEGVGISDTGLIDTTKYDAAMRPPNKDWHEVPANTRVYRVEGRRANKDVLVTVRLLPLGK